ncbi:MAG: transposase [Rhodocyclaceae bacterium]|nr:transposase [Rhodocyclaceae bacterium]
MAGVGHASGHKFLANWLRPMFAAFAYTLTQRLREIALAGTKLAQATTGTTRARRLKLGAAILRHARGVRTLLASRHPPREIFVTTPRSLAP